MYIKVFFSWVTNTKHNDHDLETEMYTDVHVLIVDECQDLKENLIIEL